MHNIRRVGPPRLTMLRRAAIIATTPVRTTRLHLGFTCVGVLAAIDRTKHARVRVCGSLFVETVHDPLVQPRVHWRAGVRIHRTRDRGGF